MEECCWQRKTKELGEKSVAVPTLSTTNPTWINLRLHGERPATNHLSHGTAQKSSLHWDRKCCQANAVLVYHGLGVFALECTYMCERTSQELLRVAVSSFTLEVNAPLHTMLWYGIIFPDSPIESINEVFIKHLCMWAWCM
jgi:hypothetical protein